MSAIGRWTPYSPTLTGVTVGAGTLVTEHRTSGEDEEVHVQFTLGAGSAITSSVDIPLPAAVKAGFSTFAQIGFGAAIDTGNGFNHVTVHLVSSTVARVYAMRVDGTYSTFATLAATVPFAFGVGDGFDVTMKYRRA